MAKLEIETDEAKINLKELNALASKLDIKLKSLFKPEPIFIRHPQWYISRSQCDGFEINFGYDGYDHALILNDEQQKDLLKQLTKANESNNTK